MRICRITIDVTYADDAEGAPESEKAVYGLIDRVLDPELSDYSSCRTGVLLRVDVPDSPKGRGKVSGAAWLRHVDEQIALLDVERFAVTRVVDTLVPVQRTIKTTTKTTKTRKAR